MARAALDAFAIAVQMQDAGVAAAVCLRAPTTDDQLQQHANREIHSSDGERAPRRKIEFVASQNVDDGAQEHDS